MTTIKRTRANSQSDLVEALNKFIALLTEQGEDEAIETLEKAKSLLKTAKASSPELTQGLELIKDAFEGEHELIAYTHHRNTTDWTDREELATASTRVLSLTQRLVTQGS